MVVKKCRFSGLLPAKWKLSPRPDHVPAWASLNEEEQQWEADRMEVFAAMVDVLDGAANKWFRPSDVCVAPDGSEVRILCQVAGGSMAEFTLPPGTVSRILPR